MKTSAQGAPLTTVPNIFLTSVIEVFFKANRVAKVTTIEVVTDVISLISPSESNNPKIIEVAEPAIIATMVYAR